MSDCTPTTGDVNEKGYAVKHGKKLARLMWIERHGPIPEGFDVDHECRNRACINEEHHRLLTVAENRGMANREKESCPQGHAYDEKNTKWLRPQVPGRAPRRDCRECSNARRRVNV